MSHNKSHNIMAMAIMKTGSAQTGSLIEKYSIKITSI